MRMWRSTLAVLLVVVFAACGGETRVGSEGLTEFEEQEQGRIGELEDFVADEGVEGGQLGVGEKERKADGGDTADVQAGAQAEAEKQREAEQQRRQEEAAVQFIITNQGYDPYFLQVFAGGVIKATNRDSQARTVTATNGEFDSGSLAPGASWTYVIDLPPGDYLFEDKTRPYVTGTLRVISRPS